MSDCLFLQVSREKANVRYNDKGPSLSFVRVNHSLGDFPIMTKQHNLEDSVCKIYINDVFMGTGFVLFGEFILTCAHLFPQNADTNVFVSFTSHTTYYFAVKDMALDRDHDYAVLQLQPEAYDLNHQPQGNIVKVPPGLLTTFAPVPTAGKGYIIGYSNGDKKIHDIPIIEKEKRHQVVENYIDKCDNTDTMQSIFQDLNDQKICDVFVGGHKADGVVTYITVLYEGSSGSPVLNDDGVIALHVGGFNFKVQDDRYHVFQFALPVLNIFEQFVSNLKQTGNKDMLRRIEVNIRGNQHLEEIFKRVIGTVGNINICSWPTQHVLRNPRI